MNKTEKLDELFSSWENEGLFAPKGQLGQFISDGIVCEKQFEECPLKVLFVLKDTNDRNPELTYRRGICDEVLKSDALGEVWNRIAEWARALTEGVLTYIHADDLKKEDCEAPDERDGARKYFKRIAILNLKKASGKGNITVKNLQRYAADSSDEIDRIKTELSIISPDVIIACSSDAFSILQSMIFKDKFEITDTPFCFKGNMQGYGSYFDIGPFLNSSKPVYVIEYRHPNRSGFSKEHYQNMLAIREFVLKNR